MINQIASFLGNFKIDEDPIVTNDFILTMDHYRFQQVNARLYSNFVVLEFKKTKSIVKIPFLFDLLFEILEPQSKHQKASITFFKQNKYLYLEGITDLQNISIWKYHLKQSLNQQGFHKAYRSIKKIGKGGFATVYMVKRTCDNKIFAAKVFLKEYVYGMDKGKQALINQINILRNMDHPNVIKIEEVFQTKNSIYLVLELIEGESLGSKIKQLQKISLQNVKTIMKSILQGLTYLHSQNIMHRDLKPDNILIKNQRLQCVIIDFGLAQYVDTKQFIYKRCGTPGYVAPQVVSIKNKNEETYNEKCDMFSLGIIFHQLLLKKSPFCDKNYKDVLLRNKMCNLDFTKLQYTHLSKQSLNLLKRLLEKDPLKRISGMQVLHHPFFCEQISLGHRSFIKNIKTQKSECDEEQNYMVSINIIEVNRKSKFDFAKSPRITINLRKTSLTKKDSSERLKITSILHKQKKQTYESISSSESFRSHVINTKQNLNVKPSQCQKNSRFKTLLNH